METFADYILSEKNWGRKLEILYYLQKKTGIFYDNSVIFKTLLAKLFLDYAKLDVNDNEVITACLLCNCKKNNLPGDLSRIKLYAKEGAEYLSELGFSDRFCRICEGVNRYTINENREKESDILELVDQFGGMLLDRPERAGFRPEDALIQLERANLKDVNNIYLDKFHEFVNMMLEVEV